MSRRSGATPHAASTFADPFEWSPGRLYPLLFVVALAAYWPALRGGVLWDDLSHLTRPDLRSLDGLRRIWFEIGATQQYYPLLHSAFWLEHRLWGGATPGYHLVNLIQHVTAACLFAALLRRLAIPGAALAALLFALHPVCVESVAWISEQKNTLSAVLYLGAALAFLRFAGGAGGESESESEGEGGRKRDFRDASAPRSHSHFHSHSRSRAKRAYALATLFFVCALLTKTVTATLPAALLVIIWWGRGKLTWRHDVVPLLPWFALSLAGGTLTAYFEHALIGAQGAAFDLSLLERALLAGRVVWFYLGKLLWPVDLTFIYPRWSIDASAWWQWLFPLATVALLVALWRLARSGSHGNATPPSHHVAGVADAGVGLTEAGYNRADRRALATGWVKPAWLSSRLSARSRRAPLAAALLFGGTLFPVLGFFNVYPFLFSYVADHFQYLAILPVLALIAAGIAVGSAALPRNGRLAIALFLTVSFGGATYRQARDYRDELTLYRATLERNPEAWLAHNNLAMILSESGAVAEAVPHLERALQLHPEFPQALSNLGDALTRLGRPAEAMPHFERALELQPDYADAHNNLGVTLVALNRLDQAVAHYQRAVEIRPDYANAQFNLGVALARLHRVPEAIPAFQRAVELRPNHAEAQLGLAFALTSTNRFDEAVPHFEQALALNPDSVNANRTYARALADHGQLQRALGYFRRVVELAPMSGPAHEDLAFALQQLGRPDEAQPHFLEAQRLQGP